jgi:hypothetical protein
VPHHVEVIGAHGVQHPAMQLAERRYDAIADGRGGPEVEPSIESVRERQLHVFDVTEGPERSKTEKPWNQENESFARGGIMRLAARCGTAPTRRKRTSRVASWTYTGDIP